MTVSSDIKVKLIYSALSIFFLPHSFFIHLMKGIWNSRPEKYLYPLEIIGTLNSDCPLSLILSIVLGRCKIVSASSLSQKCSKLDTISIFFFLQNLKGGIFNFKIRAFTLAVYIESNYCPTLRRFSCFPKTAALCTAISTDVFFRCVFRQAFLFSSESWHILKKLGSLKSVKLNRVSVHATAHSSSFPPPLTSEPMAKRLVVMQDTARVKQEQI